MRSPTTTATLPNASVTCNQAAPTGTVTTRNPNKVVFDDPANSGKVCVYTDPGDGPLNRQLLVWRDVGWEAMAVTGRQSVGCRAEMRSVGA